MRKILVLATLMFSVATSFAQDVTVDQIIDTYFENIGGKEAWGALKGHKMSAEVAAQGMVIPVQVYVMQNGKTITKISVQGMELAQGAFDGEVSWSTNFMSMKPEKSDAETTENAKRESKDYPDPFFNYKDKGYTCELMGSENIDGVDCFKVKLVKSPLVVDGEEQENVVYYYFDSENYVPVRTEQEIMSGPMKGQNAVTEYSDYQEVDGLYFPFSITYRSENGEGQTIDFDTVELNPNVDDKFFAYPGEE